MGEYFERDYKLNDSDQELFVSTRLVKQLHLQTELRNSPKSHRLFSTSKDQKRINSPKILKKSSSGENLSQRRHSTPKLSTPANPFWLGHTPMPDPSLPSLSKSGLTSADESVVESSESTLFGCLSDSELHDTMKRNRRFPLQVTEYLGDDEESESEKTRKPLSARNRAYLKQLNVKKRAVRKVSIPKNFAPKDGDMQ